MRLYSSHGFSFITGIIESQYISFLKIFNIVEAMISDQVAYTEYNASNLIARTLIIRLISFSAYSPVIQHRLTAIKARVLREIKYEEC